MRTVDDDLYEEQVKLTNTPAMKLNVQEFGHPIQTQLTRQGFLDWIKVYATTGTGYPSGIALNSTGTIMHRVRLTSGSSHIYYQKVTNPDTDSDYTTWTDFQTATASDVAIAAYGASEVSIAYLHGSLLVVSTSTDAGANWGTWTTRIDGTIIGGGGYSTNYYVDIAIAYDSSGDLLVTLAAALSYFTQTSAGPPPLGRCSVKSWLLTIKRTSGSWGSVTQTWIYRWLRNSTPDSTLSWDATQRIYSLANFYDGATPCALVRCKDTIYELTYNGSNWVSVTDLGATVQGVNLYPTVTASLTSAETDNIQMASMQPFTWNPLSGMLSRNVSRSASYKGAPYWVTSPSSTTYGTKAFWGEIGLRTAGSALDSSLLSELYMEKITLGSVTRIFASAVSTSDVTFIVSAEDAAFTDNSWEKGNILNTIALEGMDFSLASIYLWCASNKEVWRAPLPITWVPASGDGVGVDEYEIPTADIRKVTSTAQGIDIYLDNSDGTYNSPGAGDITSIVPGSRIQVYQGCVVDSTPIYSESMRVFIDSYGYGQDDTGFYFLLRCIDAWEIADRVKVNCPVSWNKTTDDVTAYEILELLVQAIGGTLDYKTKSSEIDAIYPNIEATAGTTIAALIDQIITIVPDTLFFFGLDGYIVYPQSTDSEVYYYEFPSS